MRKTLICLPVAAVVALSACGSQNTSTPPAKAPTSSGSTSTKIADNGGYGTFLDTYQVNGLTVTCIVVAMQASTSLSCDWPQK